MKHNWWIIISYILAGIAFLVVATYAILFATGYKFDWQSHSLKKTGFILIESYPKGAKVTLAGRNIIKATPVTIKRLLPGQYLTEINKDGYRSWRATIEVKPGLVTEKRNLLLTWEKLEPVTLLAKKINLFSVSPDYGKLALVANKEITFWDIKTKAEVSISDPALMKQRIFDADKNDIANGNITDIKFGPDNITLLLQIVGKLNTYYVALDSETGKANLLIKSKGLHDWQWLDANELIFMQGNILQLVNLNPVTVKKMAANIFQYAIIDNEIYGINQDKFGKRSLIKINKNGESKIEATDLPTASNYQLAKIKNNWLIITKYTATSPSSIWWSQKQDGQITWSKLANNIVAPVLWSDDYLVFQSGEKITLIKIDQDNLEPQPIFTSAKPLTLVYLSFDTILYLDQGKLKSLDLTGNNNYELITVKNVSEMVPVSTELSQLIYIDPSTRELKSVSLRDKTTNLLDIIK